MSFTFRSLGRFLPSMVAILAAASLAGAAGIAQAHERPSPVESPALEPCIVSTAFASEDADPLQPPPDRDLMRPPSDQEMQQLLRALEPVPLRDGQGLAIRAATEETMPLKPDRFGVLIGDALSLLASLHARESLDDLRGIRGIDPQTQRAFERDLNLMINCGERRFAERGGAQAMRQTLELVRKYRGDLEKRLIDKLNPAVVKKGGPR
jgi:hypothetical protein